jgi:hypothetical protein
MMSHPHTKQKELRCKPEQGHLDDSFLPFLLNNRSDDRGKYHGDKADSYTLKMSDSADVACAFTQEWNNEPVIDGQHYHLECDGDDEESRRGNMDHAQPCIGHATLLHSECEDNSV